MKSENFRIGNIVLFSGGIQTTIDGISKRIRPDCGYFELEGLSRPIKGIHITGILLTEEWLLKFRFDEIEMSIPVEYKTKKGFRIKEDERGYWMQYKYGIVIIKHVHQLQNLYFALTGEELTIKENNL